MKQNLFNRIIWVFTIALSIFVILLSISVFTPFLFGLKPYTITSSSMNPVFEKGDIVYVKKVDLANLKQDDIITFMPQDGTILVTHRITKIEQENNLIYTKGDANSNEDFTPIRYEDIVGVYSNYKLPFLRWFY